MSIHTFDMMEQSRSHGIPVASSGARRKTQSRGRVSEYSSESWLNIIEPSPVIAANVDNPSPFITA